jgi:5-methylcytosine-specific restriction enzyme subunit McrC
MAPPIPILNIYYMFCYAWNRFPEGRSIETGTTDSPEIVDLFATVLMKGVRGLIRRGLDRGYLEVAEDTSSPRGRIVLGSTIRRNLRLRGQVHCLFDELQYNVLHNQIIKTTLRRLANAERLDPELAHELSTLHGRLGWISEIRLSGDVFRRVQVSRNMGHYELLIRICELLHEYLLPEQGGGRSKFMDVVKDQSKMALIFQDFVRNFFHLEQKVYRVSGGTIYWDAEAPKQEDVQFLPEMRTDMMLRSSKHTIVIDTKYYAEALVRHFGARKLRADHMYQLFSYLKNLERVDGPDSKADGILLYPTVETSLHLEYQIGDHRVSILSINLNQHWSKIHADLLAILPVGDRSKAVSDANADVAFRPP